MLGRGSIGEGRVIAREGSNPVIVSLAEFDAGIGEENEPTTVNVPELAMK